MNPRRAAIVAQARDFIRVGRIDDALAAVEPLIKLDPRNPELLSLAARAHNAAARHPQAIALATRSLAALEHPEALMARGDSLRAEGRTDEAIADLRRAIALAPTMLDLKVALVATLEEAGRTELARAELQPVLEQIARGREPLPQRVAYEHAKLLVREGAWGEAVATIDATIDGTIDATIDGIITHAASAPAPGSIPFLMLMFLRAKALDRAGDYAGAWESARRAQDSRRVQFDPAAHARETDELIAFWTRDRVRALESSGNTDPTAVFITGMPRSGTSLVDQIIDAHPQAAGVGELDSVERWAEAACAHRREAISSRDYSRVAREYLAQVRRLSPSASRIVNKALGNDRILGHIALLFPATRIVHITRDPRDVAVSCVMGAFGSTRYPWTTRPEWVAAAWRDSQRLMAHWTSVLDVPILEVSYEKLAREGDGQIRRIIDFVGLSWDERVHGFHASRRTVRTLSYDQVSRPLYTASIGRWEHYAPQLAGVDWPEATT